MFLTSGLRLSVRRMWIGVLWACMAIAVIAGGVCRPASAQVYNVLHVFSTQSGSDGTNPYAGLALDGQGNLYGTTYVGGSHFVGTVFKVDPSGNETVLYNFTDVADGGLPRAGVILDAQGNLYGTTPFGSANDAGTVFKLDPSGHVTVLHTFTGGADGATSYAGLILDSQGNLYGTTTQGGASNQNIFGGFGYGVVFMLDPSGNETVLHTFSGGQDGAYPYAGLIQDSQGNLYGTATQGGTTSNLYFYGAGVVFKIDTSGNYSVLHTFTGGTDGAYPFGGLVVDSQGNLYGTTMSGGKFGEGLVYKLDPSGNETMLYAFPNGASGVAPYSGVVMDSQGNLYGTTYEGGVGPGGGYGLVFEVDPSGHETVLYSFTGGTDGAYPFAGLIADPQGNLYGTTTLGGGSGDLGVVFALNPTGTTIPSSVSVVPNFVTDGNTALGTVTLNGYALTGGASVSLSSSNPNVASVPATVAIPAGQTSATFPVATSAVKGDTPITISAAYNGSTATATVTVMKRALKSVKVRPKMVKGGKPAIGTVILTQPAPVGGAVVSLSSSRSSVASVPASVTVPSGKKHATFTITTASVSVTTPVTLTAAYGGTAKAASLTVQP